MHGKGLNFSCARGTSGAEVNFANFSVLLLILKPVNVFVNYIYGQRIPRRGRPWLEVTEQKGGKAAAHLAPVKAICLADRLLATNFKEALHNSYVDGLVADSYVNNSIYAAVIYAFHHLPQDDPLLKFLIHAQSSYWKDSYVSAETGDHELLKELPHEFLCGVMTRMSELRGRKYADWGLYPCDYHLHKDEGEKEQCSAYKKQMGMKP